MRTRLLGLRTFAQRPLTAPFMWSFGGDLASKGGILLFTLIVARSLQPIQFGVFVGLFATVSVAAGIWDLGISTLITRELAANRLRGKPAARQALAVRLRTFPLLVTVYAVGVAILTHAHRVPGLALGLFAGSALLIGLHAVPLGMLRSRLLFREAAAAYGAGRWLTTGVALSALALEGDSARLNDFAFSMLLGELCTLALAIVAVAGRYRDGEPDASPVTPSQLTIRAALPFAATSLLSLVYNRLDVVVLASLSTAGQLARYAPASRIQDALFLLPSSIGAVALPVIASAWSRPDGPAYVQRFVRRLTAGSVAIALPVAAVMFAFAPSIIRAVLGSSYLGTVTPLRILVWFLPFSAASAPLLAALAGTGHAIDATKVIALAFATAIALHFAFDWWWGANGASTASMLRDPAALALALVLAFRIGIRLLPAAPRAATQGVA